MKRDYWWKMKNSSNNKLKFLIINDNKEVRYLITKHARKSLVNPQSLKILRIRVQD
jgi:hypothetical protein